MVNPFESIESRLSNIENILLDLKREAVSPSNYPTEEHPLTLAEAAKFLSISNQTLYKRTGSREIPCIKVPGQKRLYFLKADLIEYLKTGRKKTGREIEAEADQYLANKKGARS